jgi:hypothetical protein
MMRPSDLVKAALQRRDHVGALFGPIEIAGINELSPCWRRLLHAIATRTPVRWTAGPRSLPGWLDAGLIDVASAAPQMPEITQVSAATAYHEAIEAIRWARQLIASGNASPEEIGIASVTPADYDDHFLALRVDANLDLHFVHGVKITASREGQAAAALVDILVRAIPDPGAAPGSVAGSLPRPVSVAARRLDARPPGGRAAGIPASVDAVTRSPDSSRLARRRQSQSQAARDHLAGVTRH